MVSGKGHINGNRYLWIKRKSRSTRACKGDFFLRRCYRRHSRHWPLTSQQAQGFEYHKCPNPVIDAPADNPVIGEYEWVGVDYRSFETRTLSSDFPAAPSLNVLAPNYTMTIPTPPFTTDSSVSM